MELFFPEEMEINEEDRKVLQKLVDVLEDKENQKGDLRMVLPAFLANVLHSLHDQLVDRFFQLAQFPAQQEGAEETKKLFHSGAFLNFMDTVREIYLKIPASSNGAAKTSESDEVAASDLY